MNKCLFIITFFYAGMASAQQTYDSSPVIAPTTQLTATLSQDAYYSGAFIDADHSVTFHQSGHLASGLLKEDFSQQGFTFKSGSAVSFFENGQIKAGTLAKDIQTDSITLLADSYLVLWGNNQIRNATLKKGSQPDNKNLQLPVNMEVQYSSNGHLTSISPYKSEAYFLFGKLLKGQSQLLYDEIHDEYKLYKGTLAEAEVIASLATGVSAYGNTTQTMAIIAPRNTTFSLFQANPLYAGGQQSFDIYYLPDSIEINQYDFGDNPALYVRDMQLHAVQIQQDLQLHQHQYKAGQLILLNQKGEAIRP